MNARRRMGLSPDRRDSLPPEQQILLELFCQGASLTVNVSDGSQALITALQQQWPVHFD
jgi:hypothetical protein